MTPACERVKVLTYAEGMYIVSSTKHTGPCAYLVRWCPKDGHVVQLASDATPEQALRSIREHRVLGDTIEHLLLLELA